jgi:hypothetical protein
VPAASVSAASAQEASPPPAHAAPIDRDDDDFPILTDAMPAPVAEAPGVERSNAPPAEAVATASIATAASLEDVPLLTDAVEEIEAPSVLELPEDDGGLLDEAFEHAEQRHEPRAPAQVQGAQAYELPQPDLPAWVGGRMREVIHAQVYDAPAIEEIEARPVDHDAFRPVGHDEPPSAGHDEPPLVGHDEPPLAGRDEPPLAGATAPDGVADALAAEDVPHEPVTTSDLPHRHDAAANTVRPAVDTAVERPADQRAADERRWHDMAEEIRMQVLQRIDLFTDTGLREQLAQRLQPIVDRAAADLVATINQHVGVILRAYVSEAIEREIERWRREGR